MRLIASVFLAATAVALAAGPARANDMDVSLARLRIAAGDNDPNSPTFCPTTVAGGGTRSFCPNNGAWANLMSELGGSALPVVLSPARTVGYGGFQLQLEGWISGINGNNSFWEVGTEGDERAGTETCTDSDGNITSSGLGCNRFTSDVLFWTRLMARKGFPLGFELGTGFSYLTNTSLWAWALEIKWAIFEGFRRGFPGVIPDISVRGMVNTVVGDPEFNLTVPSVDITISKPLVFFGTTRITPFVSWQIGWIFGDSELVDLTPDRDAFAECMPAATGSGTACTGDPSDYNNNTTFDQLRFSRHRLHIGFQVQYQVLLVTGAFAFDLAEPGESNDLAHSPDVQAQVGGRPGARLSDLPRQWNVSFGAGVSFN